MSWSALATAWSDGLWSLHWDGRAPSSGVAVLGVSSGVRERHGQRSSDCALSNGVGCFLMGQMGISTSILAVRLLVSVRPWCLLVGCSYRVMVLDGAAQIVEAHGIWPAGCLRSLLIFSLRAKLNLGSEDKLEVHLGNTTQRQAMVDGGMTHVTYKFEFLWKMLPENMLLLYTFDKFQDI